MFSDVTFTLSHLYYAVLTDRANYYKLNKSEAFIIIVTLCLPVSKTDLINCRS